MIPRYSSFGRRSRHRSSGGGGGGSEDGAGGTMYAGSETSQASCRLPSELLAVTDDRERASWQSSGAGPVCDSDRISSEALRTMASGHGNSGGAVATAAEVALPPKAKRGLGHRISRKLSKLLGGGGTGHDA